MKRFMITLFTLLAFTGLWAGSWEQLGRVATGTQFNATVGTDGHIHIITNRYLRVNTDGTVVETNTSVADGHMGLLDYFPAIAAGTDGSIHVVTRDAGGDYDEGHVIRYWKRKPDGTWLSSVKLADPSQRNYIVAVTATDDGNAWVAHSYMESYGVVPRFYRVSSDNTGLYLGSFTTQTMRADTHIRMEHDANAVLLVLSDHYGERPVSMYRAAGSTSLPSTLYFSRWTVGYNEERQGMVGTHMYDDGVFDLVYGLNLTSTVRFCRYNPDKTAIRKNVLALSDMGRWHCPDGCPDPGGLPPISVVAGTPDEQTVMVVGIRGDQTEHLENGELVYAVSTDGGANFGPRQSMGKYTHAGDGRLLPRLLYLDNTFYLVYRDNSVGGVSVARYTTGSVVPSVETPSISPDGGTFSGSVSVSLACATSGASIYYTTDGTTPTTSSTAYSGAFTLTSSATVKAKAFVDGMTESGTASASFTVTVPVPISLPFAMNAGNNTVSGWDADSPYGNGGAFYTTSNTITTAGVADAGPAAMYQSCRHLAPSFDFLLADGEYTVRLHFCEPHHTDMTAAATRNMDVKIEGNTVLSSFNPGVAAGACQKAYVYQTDITVTGGDGLQIDLVDNGGDAFIMGIEVMDKTGMIVSDHGSRIADMNMTAGNFIIYDLRGKAVNRLQAEPGVYYMRDGASFIKIVITR